MNRLTLWLREQLADHAPDAGAIRSSLPALLGTAASLQAGRGLMFGMMYSGPPIPERDELLAETVAIIERWLPLLDSRERAEIEPALEALGITA